MLGGLYAGIAEGLSHALAVPVESCSPAALSGAASSFRMLGPLSPLRSCPVDFLGDLSYQEVLVSLSLRIRQETGHRGWFCGGRHPCTCQLQTPARRRPFPLVVSGTQTHGEELSPSRSTVFIEC